MHRSLLKHLVDPESGEAPLRLVEVEEELDGEIMFGRLAAAGSGVYAIARGIPRLVPGMDDGQRQTEESFGFKWSRRDTYESEAFRKQARDWLVSRYGFDSTEEMRRFFAGHDLILDAGCGSGFATSLWLDRDWRGPSKAEWVGVDISDAIDVARTRLGDIGGLHFVQGDVTRLPFKPGTFDVAISEGVLHHTPSTEAAFRSLAASVAPGGELLAYIYRRKSPIREFADDHVRAALGRMEPEEAWEALRPLTELGRALADLDATITLDEDIPYLGIPSGTHDVQRLVYWHILKLFWSKDFSFEENHHVNFDWYAPRYAHRHTEEELRAWCDACGLVIHHLDIQESGFTVRAAKQ
jgi:arsenite methyltransferase